MNERLKEKLVLNRLDQVYCKLAPSKIHGIGIFAIKDIPKGINPFKNSYMAQDSILIDKTKIPIEYKEYLNNYHPNNNNNKQIISLYPNQLIWTNYINYSYDKPNIKLNENGEWQTIIDIKKEDELLENPNQLFNEDGTFKIFKIKENQYPILK